MREKFGIDTKIKVISEIIWHNSKFITKLNGRLYSTLCSYWEINDNALHESISCG